MSHHLSFVLLVDSLTKTYILTTTHLSNTPLTKYFILLSNLIKEMRKGIVESTLPHSPLCGKQYIYQACPPIDYSFRALLLFKSCVFFFFCFKHHWNWQNSKTDFGFSLGMLQDQADTLFCWSFGWWKSFRSPWRPLMFTPALHPSLLVPSWESSLSHFLISRFYLNYLVANLNYCTE